jgi:pimeloyl-ACP methyl ester carboxylesterase
MAASRFYQLTAFDGTEIACEAVGDPRHPPVILSHGGGQTRHSWGGTAQQLASQGWYAISYDHRGHGDSGWSPDTLYNFDRFASDLCTVAASCETKPAVVGASLGGLSAMLCAGEVAPDMLASVTLVDVTPSLNRAGVEHIFAFMSHRMDEGFANLDEAADCIAEFTGRPRRSDTKGLAKNLRLRNGRYFWHWDPHFFNLSDDQGSLLGRMNKAAQKMTLPVMLVRGQMSDVVTQTQVDEFLSLVPHADYVDVEKARHMVAGDANDIFTDAVLDFLSRQHR